MFDDTLSGRLFGYGRIADQQSYDFIDGLLIARFSTCIGLPTAGKLVQPADHGLVTIALFAFQTDDFRQTRKCVFHDT